MLKEDIMFIKKSTNMQILFAPVTHLVEGLSWDISYFKGGKLSNLLSGYTETNSVHNRRTVNFVLEIVNKK
jgi:hypothetical protein